MSEIRDFTGPSLTTIERYLLRSERQGGSLVFASEADFDGTIDAEVFTAAVRFALAHHPLMGSIVDSSSKAPAWRPGPLENVFRQRRTAELSQAFHDPIEAIDLTRSPGVRIQLTSTDDGRARIVANYHHVCADGQGAARFFRDICAVYSMLLKSETPKLNLERERLENRQDFARPDGQSPIGLAEGLRNLWVTIRGQNATFARLDDTHAADPAGSLVVEAQLEDALTAQIRTYLWQRQCVLNDFALAAALLMLAQTDGISPSRYLTILNPVDLRGWADRRLPATNRVGFAFIRRRPQDWSTTESLVQSVNQQMRYVRQRGVAAELIKGVGLVERIPGCLTLLENSKRFRSTATLTCMSNLSIGRRHGLLRHGDGWKLGDARVQRVSVAAPLPPGVPLAITVIDSGGKILITMRGCCQYFTRPLLNRLVEGLQSECELICRSPHT